MDPQQEEWISTAMGPLCQIYKEKKTIFAICEAEGAKGGKILMVGNVLKF